MKHCQFPKCPETRIFSRDLCQRHYNYAAQLVHRKQTTWAKLESLGTVGHANHKRGRKPKIAAMFLEPK